MEAPAQLQAMRDAFARTRPEAFVAGTETIEKTDLSELAPRISALTLLLAGDEDNMTPYSPAHSGVGMSAIARQLRHCESRTLTQCGHYLVIEQPELAANHVRDFITSSRDAGTQGSAGSAGR